MKENTINIHQYEEVIAKVDRQHFVQNSQHELVIGRSVPSRELIQRCLAICTLPPSPRILQLGAGVGYAAAVLAGFGGHVVAIEKNAILAGVAREKLAGLGIKNIDFRIGEGNEGAPSAGPFDLILVSTPNISQHEKLWEQLAVGGQYICLERDKASHTVVVMYKNQGQHKIARTEHGYVDLAPSDDQVFVELGLVSPALLAKARKLADKNHTLIVDEISKFQHLDELKLYRSMARQYGIPLRSTEELLASADPSLFGQFSTAFLDHLQAIPLCIEGTSLVVACTQPGTPMREVQLVFPELTIEKVLVTPVDYRRLWSSLSRQAKDGRVAMEQKDTSAAGQDKDLLDSKPPDARMVAVYEALLLDAVADRASDIHLEIYHERVRVRLRIDGELRDLQHYQISRSEYLGLVNVVKLRAEMNIAERRLPQSGRAQVRVGDARFDLRVQVQPALHGEHVVIRILAQNSPLISIDSLGMSPMIAGQYRRLLNNPAGLVLVVGPTGSGKSTTLNAGLQLLADDTSRKVITIEDPVEYSIDDIQQVRVRPEIRFNFADAMRSFVRQDPDVVLVGEIRDHETALEAIRASQTGHIVLSTLHCNDAIDAVQRLFDLNVHPNSLASELLAVMAQRLAKRICEHCKYEALPDPQILKELFPRDPPKHFKAFIGKGCEQCNGTGTHGRVAVIEYLHLNAELRDGISQRIPMGQLRAQALDSGLVTMRDSALDHVVQGNIPLTELPRILPQERMAPEKRGEWQVS
ncbi:ATPase, T2SS/T4P/T4SS family [Zhongshania borealis]|uniref:Bacterial type II secretion system protein E domain-containing protein n=1 Tax=Zhongshania borealis TaxID=889488 RepID=A0ABP7WDR5_9GAMM